MVESDSRHFLWIHVKEVEQLYTCLREIGGGKGAEDWVRDTLKKRKSFSGLQYTEALFDKCLLNFGPGSDRPDDMFIDIMQMLMERSPRKRMSHILNSDGTWNKDATSLWGMAHAYYEQKVGSQAVQRVVSPLSSCFETAATCNFWREFVTRSYFCGMGLLRTGFCAFAQLQLSEKCRRFRASMFTFPTIHLLCRIGKRSSIANTCAPCNGLCIVHGVWMKGGLKV